MIVEWQVEEVLPKIHCFIYKEIFYRVVVKRYFHDSKLLLEVTTRHWSCGKFTFVFLNQAS